MAYIPRQGRSIPSSWIIVRIVCRMFIALCFEQDSDCIRVLNWKVNVNYIWPNSYSLANKIYQCNFRFLPLRNLPETLRSVPRLRQMLQLYMILEGVWMVADFHTHPLLMLYSIKKSTSSNVIIFFRHYWDGPWKHSFLYKLFTLCNMHGRHTNSIRFIDFLIKLLWYWYKFTVWSIRLEAMRCYISQSNRPGIE